MSMTTRGIVNQEVRGSVDGPKGGGVVETEDQGQPSTNFPVATQSPSGLRQPKGPTVVATFTGGSK